MIHSRPPARVGAVAALRPIRALFCMAALLAACASQPKSGDILLVDDFANPESGFTRQSDADAILDYADGEYQIQLFTPNLNVWSIAGEKQTDVAIEVKARTAGGSENNLYGVICRHRDDANFYFLAISADGYYAIGKIRESEIILLGAAVFEKSEAINTGPGENFIRAVCAGQTLGLTVNGTPLLEVADPDYADGKIGLIAGTFSDPETEVRFDNLLVTRP